MADKNNISVTAFAKTINVSEAAVRRAIKEGKLDGVYNNQTKKIDVAKSKDNTWVKTARIIKPKRGISRSKAIEKLQQAGVGEGAPNDLPTPETDDAESVIKSIVITKDMPINTSMRLREIVGLAMDKIKLQQAQGILVEKAEVERVLFKFGDEIKRGLLEIPKRVTRDIMTAPNEVEATNILTDEITQVLLKFSEIKNF